MLERIASEERRLGDGAARLAIPALVIGAVLLLGSLAAALIADDPYHLKTFFKSYLNAVYFVALISLGGLFFVVVQHATRAGWSVTVRRLGELVMANLIVVIPLCFLPILILVLAGEGSLLWKWMDPDVRAGDALYLHKEAFLNVPFWSIRAVFYLAFWALAAYFYYSNSLAQDRSGDVELTHRMQWFAPITLLLFALTLSFASVDWVKALEAHWFSTMFGVYNFAAACTGFFGLMLVIMFVLQRNGRLRNVITLEHYQDIGKLLFAFGVVFWAYIAFSQYMLIWYANIPEETAWYLARSVGEWRVLSWVLTVGHFFLPLLLFVSKHPKRTPVIAAIVGGWLVAFCFLDTFWLIHPVIPADLATATNYDDWFAAHADDAIGLSWFDLTTLVGMVALTAGFTLRRMSRVSLVPEQDPRATEALAFENL